MLSNEILNIADKLSEELTAPLKPADRKKLEKAIWSKTHKDYRSIITTIPKYNGMKSVMCMSPKGITTLYILPVVSDEDILHIAKQKKII